MQGIVKAYDPSTGTGVVISDTDMSEYELAPNALHGSLMRMLRQGQRIVFDLDERRQAGRLRLGSELDMATPGFAIPHPDDVQHPQLGEPDATA